jgi:predicted phage terminase large subunit-like protein
MNTKTLRLLLDRRSLARFACAMMPAFELSPCHRIIVEHLERLLSGRIKKLAIIAPPRHGKSLLGSVMLPSFALGKNPRETIITCSYGSDLSETWGRRVRNILNDPAFGELFPGCRLSPDSAAVYRFETTAGGEYSAVGRGGPVTGRGASLLILDDLIKDASEANSEAVCRSIVDWLMSVAFTRLSPGGRVLAIATRWSEKDPMGWILQQHGWTVLHLPAFAEANDALGRATGEALWPSRYPVEALEGIRADVGSRVFACLYQGNVAAAQGTIFKRDWFRHYQQSPEKFNRVVQSWDTSFKTGKTNDYSVCATIGQTQNGIYLLSLYRAKVEFPELKRKVGELADLWQPQEILIEDRASGQSLVQELKLATSYPVIAVAVDRDKETRASAVTGYFESGRVLFPEGAAWLADLEDELASFPGALHDDCVDAISQALNRLRDSSGGILGLIVAMQDWSSGKRPLPRTPEELKATPAPRPEASSKPKEVTHPFCKTCNVMLSPFGNSAIAGDLLCRQCGGVYLRDGTLVAKPSNIVIGVNCCPHPLRQVCGTTIRCGNCGLEATTENGGTSGMSFRQYENRRRSPYGRFGN